MSTDARPQPSLDILAPSSSTPGLRNEPGSRRSRSATPEPVDEEEMEHMRRLAMEIRGLRKKDDMLEDSSDIQLIDMVLRLTGPTQPTQAQIVAQAEVISNLTQQRQFILERFEQEREIWEADKEGWDRSAEMLIAQAHKSGPSIYKEHEAKYNATLEQQNNLLRQRLADTQSRLSDVETELARLRPLLLMQPYALMHSHPSLDMGKSARRRNEGDGAIHSLLPPEPTTPKARPTVNYYRKHDNQQNASLSKKQIGVQPPIQPKIKPRVPSQASFADARAEHLLLAAKKIGRQRASILAAMHNRYTQTAPHSSNLVDTQGVGQPLSVSHPPLTSTLEAPSTPRSSSLRPQTPGFHSPFPPPAHYKTPQAYAFVPGPNYPFYGAAPFPFSPHSARMVTPASSSPTRQPASSSSSSGLASSSKHTVDTNPKVNTNFFSWKATVTPPAFSSRPMEPPSSEYGTQKVELAPQAKAINLSALDSLYTVARSVLSPASDTRSTSSRTTDRERDNKRKGRFSLLDSPDGDLSSSANFVPESPTPKRRRINQSSTRASALTPSMAMARRSAASESSKTLSALDVLANQAASHSGSTPSSSSRDKNTEVEGLTLLETTQTKSPKTIRKPKWKEPPKRKGKEKEKEVEEVGELSVGGDDVDHVDIVSQPPAVLDISSSIDRPAKRKRPTGKPPDLPESQALDDTSNMPALLLSTPPQAELVDTDVDPHITALPD